MREQYLETEAHPRVRFELGQIEHASRKGFSDGEAVDIQAVGRIWLHGMSCKVKVHLKAIYLKESAKTRQKMAGNLLSIEAEFELKLGDFGIPVPQLVALKLDETIRVVVNVLATDVPKEKQDRK